ncbi:cupin domain-containing protein [Thermoproteus tenax]|uniref:Cupin domain containing protein n=1 Tax=Thermoproteus tenax (strain ATCC 35583 / DSM 2078 / JCM 9277 / NBRC 100435 / Kra 1) TaxID=768679 RepID=G4RM50_THETK|nr:cupin domain-containing protein [Thermoproteus tenax]CCC82645.1 Cupin domain containing protein [Thermoproteus tenax Kra 1]
MPWIFERLNDCVERRFVSGQRLTVAQFKIRAGCTVPAHSHDNEQISVILEGRALFKLGDRVLEVAAGDVVHIPPNVPHEVKALTDLVVIDAFSPRRDDWERGEDAYLRK